MVDTPLHTYNFSIHDNFGVTRRALPPIDLADDAEALAFASRVIAEMIENGPEPFVGWTMEIVEEFRLVATIPVGSAVVSASPVIPTGS